MSGYSKIRMWRPAHKCCYVIADVCGSPALVNIINRIFPLRKFVGQEDEVVFLGNYVGTGGSSCSVLELMCSIEKEYPDRVKFLLGANDFYLLNSFKDNESFISWSSNEKTSSSIISSYIKSSGKSIPLREVGYNRWCDLVPPHHKNFLSRLKPFHKNDHYYFFNSGCSWTRLAEDNDPDIFYLDKGLSYNYKKCKELKREFKFVEDKVHVASFNYGAKKPYISNKYFMLNANPPKSITVIDLESMECSIAKINKERMYSHSFSPVD